MLPLTMTLPEQQHLVRRFLDNNDQAVATSLYYFLLPKVRTALWRFDHSNLEEYTQLAMIKIFASLATWRGDSSISTWVYRVARNVALEEVRRPKYEMLSIEDHVPSYKEPKFDTIDRFKLRTKISALPPRQRRIMQLRLEGFKYHEIASELGISVGSVKSERFRATENLRTAMLT